MNQSIAQWPAEEKPREKLFRHGVEALSTVELLALVLRTGIKGMTVIDLARSLMMKWRYLRTLSTLSIAEWRSVKGLGDAKIAELLAVFELGKRFREEFVSLKSSQFLSSQAVYYYLKPRMSNLKKEVFKIMLLTAQHTLLRMVEVEKGTVNCAYPIMREVFHSALESCASALICVHNHPSGVAEPSNEDRMFTTNLKRAGDTLTITILDHIIIGHDTYFSFKDEGLL